MLGLLGDDEFRTREVSRERKSLVIVLVLVLMCDDRIMKEERGEIRLELKIK